MLYRPTTKHMEKQYPKQFLRQILLHRYKLLIQRLKRVYVLNDEQVKRLEERILNIDWLT
jgi:hypothetical protein